MLHHMTTTPFPSSADPVLPAPSSPPAPAALGTPTPLRPLTHAHLRPLLLVAALPPLFAFFYWSLSGPDFFNTNLWEWTPHALAPVPGLPYAAAAALALFTALSFAAYFLNTSASTTPPTAGPTPALPHVSSR